MLQGPVLFEVDCPEPGGTVKRTVRQALLNLEKIRYYHTQLSGFDTLFNEHVAGDLISFVNIFVSQDRHGEFFSSALVWEVDDVGLLYLTDIKPGYDGLAHFSFWDRRLRGRHVLLRESAKYAIKSLGFHRITAEIPLYTPAVLSLVEKAGFKKEGRRRQAVKWKGEWFDANIYSILESEVDDGCSDEDRTTAVAGNAVRNGLPAHALGGDEWGFRDGRGSSPA